MLHRIVIKIGSSSLTTPEGEINEQAITYFAAELATILAAGYQPLLVTSGAVAAGFREMGFLERPHLLHEKQAAAAVGQALLMQKYREALQQHGIVTAQILLTRSDFQNRKHTSNASMAIEELLKHAVLPIINENDTVSLNELKFGDNDTLSALVANLLRAEQLIILTDMDGLYTKDPRIDPTATKITTVDDINERIYSIASGAGSAVGTGGMRSKIDAAKIATRSGVPVFVGKMKQANELLHIIQGKGQGTYFSTQANALPRKKQWLGFLSTPIGTLEVDQGAEDALLQGGRSLLPVGVCGVKGHFHAGDVVEVVNAQQELLGRGVVNYDTAQLNEILGLSSGDVIKKIDGIHRLEVIHRDEWISLK